MHPAVLANVTAFLTSETVDLLAPPDLSQRDIACVGEDKEHTIVYVRSDAGPTFFAEVMQVG
jgi:hypothetical protein